MAFSFLSVVLSTFLVFSKTQCQIYSFKAFKICIGARKRKFPLDLGGEQAMQEI